MSEPARGSNPPIDLETALERCESCPRKCGANRTSGEVGACGVGRYAIVSSAFAHFGEERVLVGSGGSGTVFLAGCNLGCRFCQNREISHGLEGGEVTEEDLARLMLGLQARGCHNVNLVTPSHVALHAAVAIDCAKRAGLSLPIVYNTSAYDSVETLMQLEGLVDVYMPDFKFWTEAASKSLTEVADYPDVARSAIAEMHRQVGDLVVSPEGLAVRGLLVRHLVMPGMTEQTERIMGFLAGLSRNTYVNVMSQYRPLGDLPAALGIDRRPANAEIAAARRAATRAGLRRFAE